MLLVIAAVMKKRGKLWNETMYHTGRRIMQHINTAVCWNLTVKLNLCFYEGPCEGHALWVWTLKYTDVQNSPLGGRGHWIGSAMDNGRRKANIRLESAELDIAQRDNYFPEEVYPEEKFTRFTKSK